METCSILIGVLCARTSSALCTRALRIGGTRATFTFLLSLGGETGRIERELLFSIDPSVAYREFVATPILRCWIKLFSVCSSSAPKNNRNHSFYLIPSSGGSRSSIEKNWGSHLEQGRCNTERRSVVASVVEKGYDQRIKERGYYRVWVVAPLYS